MECFIKNTKKDILTLFCKTLGIEIIAIVLFSFLTLIVKDQKEYQLMIFLISVYMVFFFVNIIKLQRLLILKVGISKSKIKVLSYVNFSKQKLEEELKFTSLSLEEKFDFSSMKSVIYLKLDVNGEKFYIYPTKSITYQELINIFYYYKSIKIEDLTSKDQLLIKKLNEQINTLVKEI